MRAAFSAGASWQPPPRAKAHRASASGGRRREERIKEKGISAGAGWKNVSGGVGARFSNRSSNSPLHFYAARRGAVCPAPAAWWHPFQSSLGTNSALQLVTSLSLQGEHLRR